MSHVAEIDLHIKDLDCLKKAAARCGLDFHENKTTYKWYGTHMGDYPPPPGFDPKELGTCEHALSVKGKPGAYEVGVVKRRDGKPGYTLLWDFWSGGYGLEDAIGPEAGLLRQAYSTEVARKQAIREGFKVTEIRKADGRIVLTASK